METRRRGRGRATRRPARPEAPAHGETRGLVTMQLVGSGTPATGHGPAGGRRSRPRGRSRAGASGRPPRVRGLSLVCRAGAGASRSWGALFGWGLHVCGSWGAHTPSRPAEPGLLGWPRLAAPGLLDNPHTLALRLLLHPRCLGGPQREVPLLPTVEGGARGPRPPRLSSSQEAVREPLAEGGAPAPTPTFVLFRFTSGFLAHYRRWPGHSPLPALVAGPRSVAVRRGPEPRTPASSCERLLLCG